MRLTRSLVVGAAAAALAPAACGSTEAGVSGATPATTTEPAPAARTAAGRLTDWPMFGLSPSRPGATNASPGITAPGLGGLHRRQVAVPGTVDSGPIILGGTAYATTTYGKTVAVDLATGRLRWTFTPSSFGRLAGSAQITNASPAADPSRRWIFAASPDGAIHKLSAADGREAPGWPVTITRDATHEKLTSSLNVSGSRVIATMGGYVGDAPPYQGKVVTLDRGSGHIDGVFNSLCSDRATIIVPWSCAASDAAIWGRAGAVVLPGSGDLLAATSNGPFDGVHNWGDSVVRLSPDARRLLAHWTPAQQAAYEAGDVDVGSASPAYLGGGLVLQGGKDSRLHLLALSRLYGTTGAAGRRLGGDLQVLPTPGGQMMFTAPAVWHDGSRTTVVVTTGGGTTAYAVRESRLRPLWGNAHAGTSPVIAGGLLYVYDPTGGGVRVYRAATGRSVGTLKAGVGHWNSPAVGGGHLVLGEGDANDHQTNGGVLDIWSAG
ncbi:PQQ-binding-like beta-propeller repeat protein [Baekduia soli]|uniref:PQQ-binding-like beta-propeller repeat protein n=1 Tax=Baekduia soli TaxID=496014 RepID=A0A5B8U508_9ACTN|nr:PQQ-binding-like beta-propeller repeat protein [Baekduia soli]QEC47975.1 PQQ-binding-like beta-propeller repeat protein [Baekduia soli]